MILDILLLVLLSYLVYVGYKKGFITSLLGVTGDFLCMLVSYMLLNKLSNSIDKLSYGIKSIICNNITINAITENADIISGYVAKILLACLIFIIARLLLNVIKKVLKFPLKIACVSSLDKVLGVLFNVLRYVLVCSVLSIVMKTIFIDNGISVNSFIVNNVFINNEVLLYVTNYFGLLLKG